MIRRPPRSTHCISSAASDVYKRQGINAEYMGDLEIHIEYLASPSLDDKTLIIADPMLATGGSMELGFKALTTKGMPRWVHVACVIATQEAVEFISHVFPKDRTTIWCAAIDPELNEHKYIVPGLGDAGDLAYGDKLQQVYPVANTYTISIKQTKRICTLLSVDIKVYIRFLVNNILGG
eukprot:TRINITY_DN26557_c0_g1_i2.p1 TRINITY_DN26557_c0_g1~~TRINITY_DN26557_c0_g1_i2.p1  ORF type:complete len:179 (-),score=28.34 TRINITY_DN26557_c0_g1_i2:735-1271(-)